MLKRALLLSAVAFLIPSSVAADPLAERAQACLSTLERNDRSAFEEIATEIRGWRSVFSTAARSLGAQCLTLGYEQEWVYSDQQGQFISGDDIQAERARAEDAAARRAEIDEQKAAQEKTLMAVAAEARAADADNRQRVVTAVHAACVELLEDDDVAALTNALCVESFLANGLPAR